MQRIRRPLQRLLGMFRHGRSGAEFQAEMEAHLEMHVEDLVRSGLTPAEARRRAILQLGGIESTREAYADQAGFPALENLWRDLRYAARTLRRSPAFTFAAVMSIALGIGANTGVFSLVNAVMLRPLPYPEPERLVRVVRPGSPGDISNIEYEIVKRHEESFATVAGQRGVSDVRVRTGGADEWVRAASVTPDYFKTLGVRLMLGREFVADEARPGGAPAVILTHGVWLRLFAGDPAVTGRPLQVDGRPHVVAGVTPADFRSHDQPDVFVPLRMAGGVADLGANTAVTARLREGVTPAQAAGALEAAGSEFTRLHPDHKPARGPALGAISLHEALTGGSGRKLELLLGAVGLLLLIACLNLASLIVARLSARRREVAVRLALGGDRLRLLQQIFAESFVICAIGGVAGLAAAHWLMDSLVAAIPFPLPAAGAIGIDRSVLVFTACLTLATVVLAGLGPAILHSRMAVGSAIESGGRGPTGTGRQKLRGVLVVAQVAGAAALLIGAALLAHSLFRLHRQPLGFDPDGVLTFWTRPVKKQDAAKRQAELTEILERLRALPGVSGAAAANVLPLTGQNNFPAQRENHPEASIGGMEVRIVTPDYFRTMKVPVLRGRVFGASDTAGAQPVVMINEELARTWWPSAEPLGDRLAMGMFRGKRFGEDPVRGVVGIVANTKAIRLAEPVRPTIYLPAAQALWYGGGMYFAVRGGSAESARAAIRAVDPALRADRIRMMEEIAGATASGTRFDAILFALFGGLALTVSITGVFGLLSYSVACRSGEIGTRLALGATQGQVARMILGQGLRLVAAGLATGLTVSAALSRTLSGSLFEVKAADPASFISVALVLLAAGAAASFLPARTAARVDPLTALRCD